MAEKKVELTSEQKIIKALEDAVAKNLATPVGERILEAGTVAEATGFCSTLPIATAALSLLETEQGEMVDEGVEQGVKLELNCSLFFAEMNGHINLDGNPRSVRRLFNLNETTGNNPLMDSESLKVTAGNSIKTGNEAMVTHGGWVLNTGFPASAVITRNDTFKDLIIAKSLKKDAVGAAQVSVNLQLPLAKSTADDIAAQIKYYYRDLTEAQIRDKCRGYGVEYETVKPTTRLTVITVGADGVTPVPGVLWRVGEMLTKAGKVAKEGAQNIGDEHGISVLDTSITGETNLIGKKVGFPDNTTPIKIVSEVSQSIKIVMVPL
jgi:hypothetical protein